MTQPARKTVSLAREKTGQEIINGVAAAARQYGAEFYSEKHFDDGEQFEIGQFSKYPYAQLRVTPNDEVTCFRPEMTYTGSVRVATHHWPGDYYPVGYSDDAPIEALQEFATYLEKALSVP